MDKKIPSPYDLSPLDKLLQEDIDPVELGNQLDEIMTDLVSLVSRDDHYPFDQLEWRYHLLRTLRNFFWKIEKSKP